MTIAEQVLEKLRELPLEKQKEVLEFVDNIHQQSEPEQSRPNLRGVWKGLGDDISEEEIAEFRREMWGNFPRDIG